MSLRNGSRKPFRFPKPDDGLSPEARDAQTLLAAWLLILKSLFQDLGGRGGVALRKVTLGVFGFLVVIVLGLLNSSIVGAIILAVAFIGFPFYALFAILDFVTGGIESPEESAIKDLGEQLHYPRQLAHMKEGQEVAKSPAFKKLPLWEREKMGLMQVLEAEGRSSVTEYLRKRGWRSLSDIKDSTDDD
jgi:hypothetical protein